MPQPNKHSWIMRSAARCADICRIAGPGALSDEILEEGYDHLWYAYNHASTVIRRLETQRAYEAADVWREKRDSYKTARAQCWSELVKRGLRQAALAGPYLPPPPDDGR